MKIVLYSDLHAHPYNNGVLLEHGTNSRVADAAQVIGQAYSYAVENDVDYVVFGGDLFDRRKSIDVDTYNTIHECIQTWSKKVSTIMIPGNHDQANKSGTIHALERFDSEDCAVLSEPQWRSLGDDVYLFGVPYYDDGLRIAQRIEEGLKDKPEGSRHILLIHYGIEGAKIGPSDYVLPCELKLPMLQLDEWDIIFSGHYHIGQQLGSKFHYIGSAMQHRWDDVGFEKSFVVYDSSDNSIVRIPTLAPQFLEIRDKTKNHNVKNCFVRIIRDYEISQDKKPKIEVNLKERGALSVEFRYEPEKIDIDESERIEFSDSGGEYQILDDYVSSDLIDKSSFDMVKLLDIGKKILSQAMDKV
jgi:DNA repair exonuclease SbcCD nuclease subunit